MISSKTHFGGDALPIDVILVACSEVLDFWGAAAQCNFLVVLIDFAAASMLKEMQLKKHLAIDWKNMEHARSQHR